MFEYKTKYERIHTTQTHSYKLISNNMDSQATKNKHLLLARFIPSIDKALYLRDEKYQAKIFVKQTVFFGGLDLSSLRDKNK